MIGSHGTDGSDGTGGFAVPMLKSLSPGHAKMRLDEFGNPGHQTRSRVRPEPTLLSP